MYCTKCGNKVEDGNQFCTECGNQMPTNQVSTSSTENSKIDSDLSKNKNSLIALISIGIILLVSLFACSQLFDSNNSGSSNKDHGKAEPLPGEGQYDTVLASGDGYYLVSKWVENYKEAYTEYGIINQDSTWLIPLSKNNSIAQAVDGFSTYAKSYYDLKFDYANEGMFIVRRQCCIFPESIDFYNYAGSYIANGGCYVINVETGRSYGAGAFMTKYYDGYCFYLASRFGKIIRMDRNGNTMEFTNEGKIPWGEPSNGLIYINKKFYDIQTAEVKIDLSEYDMVSEGVQKFNDDKQFTFTFRNPAGTHYSVTIDTTGAFIGEPQKLG